MKNEQIVGSDLEQFSNSQISQKSFSMKVMKLWEDIQTEVESLGYKLEDVPELIRQTRETHHH
jgi:hypothetical protein